MESGRSKAKCSFCDTDFVGTDGPGGGMFGDASELTRAITSVWLEHQSDSESSPYVVFTGGEPLLQLDSLLLAAVKQAGFEIAVETNGTLAVPPGVDWITVSPKPNAPLVQRSGQELKLVFPQEVRPEGVADLDFDHFFLMPLDSGDKLLNKRNLDDTVAYCLKHPKWRLTLQTHKIVGLA